MTDTRTASSEESAPGSKPVCPVCGGSSTGRPLARYSVQRAAAHFCPATRNSDRNARLQTVIRRLWGQESCEVRLCDACGFGFAHPYVGGDGEFYGILHEQAGYPAWKWDFDVGLQHGIAHYAGGKVIDLGAGDGAFLRRIDGTKWERFATESTPEMKQKLRDAGILVFDDENAAIREAAGLFQVVTLFQVLEHLSAFRPILAAARKLCAPGGRIVVVVPDGPGIGVQERVTGCPDMPPNHCNRWNARSLALALEHAGFRPGAPLLEPVSWRKRLPAAAFLRVQTNSVEPRTLAAQAYRIQNRKLRILALAPLIAASIVGMLPHLGSLGYSHSLAIVGEAV